MAVEVNANQPKDASRTAVLWSASRQLMTGAFWRSRIFERSKKPMRMGMLAMPQRSIAREIEELYPDQY
jgi:hypothetical protein